MGSMFTLVVSVKTACSPFVCIPNWPQQKLIAAEGSVRSGHGIVRSESAAGVAQAGSRSLCCEPHGSHGTAHGTAHFAAHFVHFCTSLPHPPHSRTPRQNPKPLQTGALQCYQSPSLCDSVPALSLPKGRPRHNC